MLAGMRIIGSVSCMHGGHLLTNEFQKILSNKDNFVIVESLENISNLKKDHSKSKKNSSKRLIKHNFTRSIFCY